MYGSYITVATCQLNQWSLDFDGNVQRILKSCQLAKASGAVYRLGPELEISGYGCEDHFLEQDTIHHCWESLVELIEAGVTKDMLCDFGMPVLYQNVRYNCRVFVLNGQILLIRPKTALADNGNYRESRWFTAWDPSVKTVQQFVLPTFVTEKLPNTPRTVPFGLPSLQVGGTTFGCESCEELWTPLSTHIGLALRGIEVVGNGSGSYHELRKLNTRLDLIRSATAKCGGVYLYANQRGCDGGRLYFDGSSMIVVNGEVVAQGSQFGLEDVEVLTATVDLNQVQSYRASIPSLGIQAQRWMGTHESSTKEDLLLVSDDSTWFIYSHGQTTSALPNGPSYHTPEEECCLGPACWLWDYLRRSGASGYFLPLSGGADSSSVATIVGCMCHLVVQACQEGNESVQKDVSRIVGIGHQKDNDDKKEHRLPSTSQELARSIFHSCFLGSENSSVATKSRAQRLGDAIGSYHLSLEIDAMVRAVLVVFQAATGKVPKFTSQGGTMVEDLALQNIQARLRMVFSFLLAQLLPWVRSSSGFLLVLGSANVDEGLRGYMTKYDCSSADLNPIGGICKKDLKRMLLWAASTYPEYTTVLREIAEAPPTAELRPKATNDEEAEHSQLDEEEMGMTYDELGWFGRLRKIHRCGPVSMFLSLTRIWGEQSSWQEIATKVQRFFRYYSMNRHKMCTLTPSYHAEAYGPDDNRFDLRQFLYNTSWSRQFRTMNELVEGHEESDTNQTDEQVSAVKKKDQ